MVPAFDSTALAAENVNSEQTKSKGNFVTNPSARLKFIVLPEIRSGAHCDKFVSIEQGKRGATPK
jgi:hypothetical protein